MRVKNFTDLNESYKRSFKMNEERFEVQKSKTNSKLKPKVLIERYLANKDSLNVVLLGT